MDQLINLHDRINITNFYVQIEFVCVISNEVSLFKPIIHCTQCSISPEMHILFTKCIKLDQNVKSGNIPTTI